MMKKYTIQKEVKAKSVIDALKKEKTGVIYQVYEMTEPVEKDNVGFKNK